jgi:hypothetical protein
VRGIDAAAGGDHLATVGRLLRFLPRLDMAMTHSSDVARHAAAFASAEEAALAGRGVASA